MHVVSLPSLADVHIGVIGLGYVGLPLAVAFSRQRPTLGFDIDQRRVTELKQQKDSTLEVSADELRAAIQLSFSHDADDLKRCNVFIITVPTPIDDFKRPDLRPLESATRFIASALKPGSVVIYESTVYPGATEEICVPILEHESGLRCNQDFFVGYSPERINPGDKLHRLETIVKVTSGSTPDAAEFVDQVYRLIVQAGTHKASSIRVAEAAKVIENTQRDVNIALINELSLIFNRLGLDTQEVLEAAGTKWNFLPFRPGLVGGHCIGVDPYYLTHKAQQIGFHPEMILAGRRINDEMGSQVARRVIKLMTQRRIHAAQARILVLGLTFKENCPDLRNTRVIDVVREFQSYNAQVDVYDPWASPAQAKAEYGLDLLPALNAANYDAIILAVSHREFITLGVQNIRALGQPHVVLFDVKQVFPKDQVDDRL